MDRHNGLLDIVWAIVLIQGGITVLSLIEALVLNAFQGGVLLPVVIITGAGAVLAFVGARGLRRRRRWARRLTMVAESLVLVVGGINLGLAAILNQQAGLMPVLTTILAPAVVLALLRKTRDWFPNKLAAEVVP